MNWIGVCGVVAMCVWGRLTEYHLQKSLPAVCVCADSKRNCFVCDTYTYMIYMIYLLRSWQWYCETFVWFSLSLLSFFLSISRTLYFYHFIFCISFDFRNQCVIEIKYLVNAYVVSSHHLLQLLFNPIKNRFLRIFCSLLCKWLIRKTNVQ